MYILIDLSQNDTIHLALFDKDNLVEHNYNGRNRELLECIYKHLQKNKVKISDLSGIMVVVGEGGFTNTRISAVVGNTFGYALGIPVMSVTKAQIGEIQTLIPKLALVPVGQYVSAKYSAEPNIG